MKKIQKITPIAIIIILLFIQNLYSQPDPLNGDFGICRSIGHNIYVKMETVSAPFEGITSPKPGSGEPLNRVGQIQNGAYWRFYINNYPTILRNIAYITGIDLNGLNNNAFMDFGHCAGKEYPQYNITNTWGFAKYKITITAQQVSPPHNSFTFKFYINSLDSKYADLNNGGYSADLYIEFEPTNEENIPRVRFYKATNNNGFETIGYIYTTDILNGEPTKEYKVWKEILKQEEPMEENFKAKSTPFPICPSLIHHQQIRVLELGTDVTLNGVYPYTGDNDKYGYNTIDSLEPWSYNYYSNPPIITGENVIGKTYVTPATYYEDGNENKICGFRLNVKADNKISIMNDHRLWISGYNNSGAYLGDTIFLHEGNSQNGASLVLESYAQLNACFGGKIIDSSAIITWNPNAFMRIYQNSEIAFWLNNNVVNNGGHIEVDGNGTFKVCDNSTVTFDGEGTYLKLNLNSIVQLGNNAKIVFKNGAKLEASGSQISSVNGSLPGRGFVFENAGEGTTITNCVFNSLSNPIYILNTTYASSNINYNISYNTFNCNDKLNYAIESKNSNVIDIGFNNILMQTGKGLGILLKYTGDLTGGESASPSYNIQIRNNQIANGVISTAVMNLTSAYPVINYRFNNFYGSATNSNVVVNHISGDIKNNSFSSNSSACVSLNLNHAIPNILSNSFTSYAKNIYNSYSYPKIGPNPENSSDGGWIWLGGKNNIQSLYDGNLYYSGGNALLDWGQNCFYKATGSNHLWGNIDEPSLLYYVRNNDFNNSNIPITNLFDIGSGYPVNTYSSGSNFGCNNSTDAGTIWLIRDLGDGITDTIYRTNNTSGYQPPADEVLYSTAINKKLIDNNFDAVSYFKSLINSYPSSSYTEACLYDLYDCYLKLDTSGNQTVKDILFTDLKNYLDSKILSGNYSDEFSDIAYQIGVMCLTVIAEYDDAMSGYEFIALYHPDAYTRLLASWEYSEIEQLLNGSGGLSSRDDNLTDEEYFVKLSKKVNKTLTGDPVKGKLKKTYEKSKTEKAERQKAEIKSNLKDEKLAKSEIQKINQKEQESKMKVVSVLRNSKSMTREEKDKRQIEDIVIGSRTEDEKQKVENMNITPERYELSQNYPNPFNPVTNIQFQVPSLKFVKLVVYDMLGREVKTLVNEIKSPGKYIVSFDASSLSSGVYFYKMTAGEFTNVKRMVLVK